MVFDDEIMELDSPFFYKLLLDSKKEEENQRINLL